MVFSIQLSYSAEMCSIKTGSKSLVCPILKFYISLRKKDCVQASN